MITFCILSISPVVIECKVEGIFGQWSPENWLDRFHSCATDCPPVGVEEGDGGGGGVEGDEGGCQGASQAPGQKALPWDHLQNQTELSVGGGKRALWCNH